MNSTNNAFGELFRSLRLKQGMSLRKFCDRYELDAGNISKIERGVQNPPLGRATLERWAGYLGLTPDTDDWYTFFDLASVTAGRIPGDVLSDDELLKSLPLFFRTVRKERVSEEDLTKLIDLIRRG